MKDLKQKLNEFREIEPDEKYWHVTRSILLNTIEADSTERQGFQFKSLFFNFGIFTRTVFPTMKMATISLVVIVTIFLTGLGAQAAGPGDFLYNGKIAIENTKVLFTKDANKTQLYFEHINNRLVEIDQLIEKDKSNHIAKATKNIKSNLQEVKKSLESMKNNKNVDNQRVVELATLIDLKTNEISETLKEKSVETENEEIKNTIKASNSLSKDALEVIIASDTELVDPELELIKNSINTKIELQRDRYDETIEKITKVKGDNLLMMEEGNTLDTDSEGITEEELSNIESSDSKPVEFNISEIDNVDSAEISSRLDKAKELLEAGDLDGALRELRRAEFYIDLTTEETDRVLEDYESRIKELEGDIQEEVKGETEQLLN